MRVLIAGCGYVGAALGERLAASGHEVYGLRRTISGLPSALHAIPADLSDPSTLRNLPGAIDWVVYAAGAPEFSEDAYRRTYVDGLQNLIDALRAQGQEPSRFLFTSSTGVYAQTGGEWVDEESTTEPATFSGTSLLEGERLVRDSPWRSIVLRLGGIYGPGRTGLINRVRSGKATREPEPSRFLNLIHLDDIVGAIVHLLELPEPAACYVGVDSAPQVWNELLEWVAGELEVELPSGDSDSESKRPPRSRRCSNRKLRESGYAFQVPTCREGYRELFRGAAGD